MTSSCSQSPPPGPDEDIIEIDVLQSIPPYNLGFFGGRSIQKIKIEKIVIEKRGGWSDNRGKHHTVWFTVSYIDDFGGSHEQKMVITYFLSKENFFDQGVWRVSSLATREISDRGFWY
jgi:hypothetical protein